MPEKPSEMIIKKALEIQEGLDDEYYQHKPEMRYVVRMTPVEKAILEYLDAHHHVTKEE